MRRFISFCWAILGKTPRYSVQEKRIALLRLPPQEMSRAMEDFVWKNKNPHNQIQYTVYDHVGGRSVYLAYNRAQVRLFIQQREPFHPWLF